MKKIKKAIAIMLMSIMLVSAPSVSYQKAYANPLLLLNPVTYQLLGALSVALVGYVVGQNVDVNEVKSEMRASIYYMKSSIYNAYQNMSMAQQAFWHLLANPGNDLALDFPDLSSSDMSKVKSDVKAVRDSGEVPPAFMTSYGEEVFKETFKASAGYQITAQQQALLDGGFTLSESDTFVKNNFDFGAFNDYTFAYQVKNFGQATYPVVLSTHGLGSSNYFYLDYFVNGYKIAMKFMYRRPSGAVVVEDLTAWNPTEIYEIYITKNGEYVGRKSYASISSAFGSQSIDNWIKENTGIDTTICRYMYQLSSAQAFSTNVSWMYVGQLTWNPSGADTVGIPTISTQAIDDAASGNIDAMVADVAATAGSTDHGSISVSYPTDGTVGTDVSVEVNAPSDTGTGTETGTGSVDLSGIEAALAAMQATLDGINANTGVQTDTSQIEKLLNDINASINDISITVPNTGVDTGEIEAKLRDIVGQLEGLQNPALDDDVVNTDLEKGLSDVNVRLDEISASMTGDLAVDLTGFNVMKDRLSVNFLHDAFGRLRDMDTSQGEAPVIKINLHKILNAGIEKINPSAVQHNKFTDEETVFIDFAKMEQYTIAGMNLIEYMRFMISCGSIWFTMRYVWRKITPDKVVL